MFRLWDPALLWDAQKGTALDIAEALGPLPHWLSRLGDTDSRIII